MPFTSPRPESGIMGAAANMNVRPGLGRWDAVKFQERTGLLLLLIVVSALFIRASCAVLFTGEMDAEGVEYTRIAQDLIAGKGYVGIATPGTQLFFPPLFPFLIAGVTWTVGNAEVAARIVSILFGTLLVLPVYLIARRMFGERTAATGATALHPYLIMFSVSVFCDLTFLTLLWRDLFGNARRVNPTARAASSGLSTA
jgi:hypothetical protein